MSGIYQYILTDNLCLKAEAGKTYRLKAETSHAYIIDDSNSVVSTPCKE